MVLLSVILVFLHRFSNTLNACIQALLVCLTGKTLQINTGPASIASDIKIEWFIRDNERLEHFVFETGWCTLDQGVGGMVAVHIPNWALFTCQERPPILSLTQTIMALKQKSQNNWIPIKWVQRLGILKRFRNLKCIHILGLLHNKWMQIWIHSFFFPKRPFKILDTGP